MKLTFRNAERSDEEALRLLHFEQQAAQGTNFELPNLFSRQFPLVIVGCDEDGIVRQCFYVESVAELRFIGCDPRCTALSQREADGLCYALKLMGFRYLECYVPRQLKKAISKPLLRARFKCKDKVLSYFSRDLRPKAGRVKPSHEDKSNQ